ncbi:MAG: hypothetical protein AAGU32_12675, partial [Bacillota bacterium]
MNTCLISMHPGHFRTGLVNVLAAINSCPEVQPVWIGNNFFMLDAMSKRGSFARTIEIIKGMMEFEGSVTAQVAILDFAIDT